ncbi:MAG: ERF family protein [Acidaminococcaceae bacterium]
MSEILKKPEKDNAVIKPTISLYQKILLVMDEVGGYVQKDKTNKEQHYNYVSEAAVLAKVQPALVKSGIIALPTYEVVSSEDKMTAKGSIWKLVTVLCRLKIVDSETGDSDTVTALGSGIDANDKAVAKAQTMAFKYAWWKLLCLETGDDPEADPLADKQQFINQQQLVQSTKEVTVELAAKDPMIEIVKMWNFAGWDINQVQDYVLKRMNRTSFDGATPSEYSTVMNDLAAYMQSQGMKVTVIPF